VPSLLLVGLIVGITVIRENAVVGYMKHVQESVPELRDESADPRVYVLLFLGVQVLFFYIAYHWSVQHYDPLLSEHHHAKIADRRGNSFSAELESLNRRLDDIAIASLSDWAEYQRLFDHRVLVFAEAAEVYWSEGHLSIPNIPLAEPPAVAWGRARLGARQLHILLPIATPREERLQ
jgi:hypothetical protein